MKVKTLEVGAVGFPKRRLRNPIFPNQVYAYHQPLFGYYGVTVNTALTRQVVFSIAQSGQYTPAGGAAVQLTEWHTNLIGQGGILPNPDRHFVKYISLRLREDVLVADAIRFLNDSLVVFFMGSTAVEYWRSHGVKVPAGSGVFGFSSAIVQNGTPEIQNQVPFWGPADPQFGISGAEIIEQGQNFGVTIDPTRVSDAAGNATYTTATTANGGMGINAHIYLDGIRVRGTQ
jgi:hypothetical protein